MLMTVKPAGDSMENDAAHKAGILLGDRPLNRMKIIS